MSVEQLNHLKNRSLWIMMMMIVVFISASIMLDYYKTRKELVQEKLTVSKKVSQLFESEKTRLVSFFSTRVKCHLASPLAMQAMEQQDRELTYQVAKNKLDILKSTNPHVTHMHFYASDGTSLMRVHNKDVFGDRIADKRPMVAHAVNNQASVFGFEEGYFGLIFRIVEPAYNAEGEYIGSLEFGLQPQYFETVIKGLFPDMKVALAISKQNLKLYTDSGRFQTHNNHYLAGEDVELLKPYIGQEVSQKQRTTDVSGNSHILIDDIVLNDFAGNPFIQMYLLKDVQELEDKFFEALYFSITIGLFSMLFLFFAARFVLNYLTDNAARLSAELAESHAKMESVFNTSKEGLAIIDLDGNLIESNRAFSQITEYSAEALINKNWNELFSNNQIAIEPLEHKVIQCVTKNGRRKTVELTLDRLPNQNLFLVACRDITLLREQQIEIENYINVVDTNVITSKTDLDGVITYVSDAFCRVSGYSQDELIGQKHSIVRHKDMPVEVYDDLWKTITSGKVWQGDILNRKKDGGQYWVSATISPDFDDDNNIIGFTAVRQDISDRKEVEKLSITDALTGLYNRRHYNEVFDSEFARRKRDGVPFLYLLMDLDHFKRYNDTYGHQKGDQVLVDFAACLQGCFKRAGDVLFRMGGEEFAAILQIKNEDEAEELINQVNIQLEKLNIEHIRNSAGSLMTASIGACLVTDYSRNYKEEQIYRMADEALYQAKSEGRDRAILKRI